VETGRLEAFADGVFAIAATLLILDVSADAPGGGLGQAVTHAWPEYAAYAISFLTIGIMWMNHRACMHQVGATDRMFIVLNLALLMCIAFVPFPTRLVAEHLRDHGLRAAALTYGITLTATAVCFAGFWFYAATGRRLIAHDVDQRTISGISRSYLPGAPIYGTSTLVALWSPKAPSLSSPQSPSSTCSRAPSSLDRPDWRDPEGA
jgi:TMEM175 potassium channel family protein